MLHAEAFSGAEVMHGPLQLLHPGFPVIAFCQADASREAMRAAFDAVTVNAARAMGLEGYGLAAGCRADFVLLHARDPIEAIRVRAARLLVVKAGRVVARAQPRLAELFLNGRPALIDPAAT